MNLKLGPMPVLAWMYAKCNILSVGMWEVLHFSSFFFLFFGLERGVSGAVPISKRLVSVSLLLVSCYENFTVPPIIVYYSRPRWVLIIVAATISLTKVVFCHKFILRTVPPYTKVFFCSLWLCRKGRCWQGLLESKNKIGGNIAFFRDN